jgi:hypothetical protein
MYAFTTAMLTTFFVSQKNKYFLLFSADFCFLPATAVQDVQDFPVVAVDRFKIVVQNAVSTLVDKSQFLHFMTIPNCEDLIEFIIRKGCEYWNYDITDGFSLHFDITDELVTKENKSTINPGSRLKFCSSRSRLASLFNTR